jgi:predicted dehydrogenase
VTAPGRAEHGGAQLAVAIAGTGFMGRVHARAALVNGARLVGVSASTPASAERAAAALGAQRAYRSSAELVADPAVQVVHVCTPNHLHADLVRAAIDAGKHVICEKPLATDLADAQDLQLRAERSGVVATVPYVYRYYAMVREARVRAQAGELGRLALIHGSYLQDWLLEPTDTNWRVDASLGGPSRSFADIGSHWCDLAEFIIGDEIERVTSQFEIVLPRRPDPADSGPTFSVGRAGAGAGVQVNTEDAAVVQFRTRGGTLGSMVVSQVAAGHRNDLHLELLGTRASLSFDQQQPDVIRIGRDGAVSVIERDPARLSPAAAPYSRLPAGHPQGYQDCVDAFVGETYAAARGGPVDPLLPTFASGVRAAAVTDAVVRASAEGGRWVTVPDLAPSGGGAAARDRAGRTH